MALLVHQVDPTRTVMLRRRYMRDASRRFRVVKSLIRTTIETNDALGIGDKAVLAFRTGPARRFDFPTSGAKAEAFMDWLDQATDSELLGVIERKGRRVVKHAAWQDVYIRSSYEVGVLSANQKLVRAGLRIPAQELFGVFNAPRHAETLGLLFSRNFEELQGITEAMSQAIGRQLVQGMAEGIGPKEMARRLSDQVDGIGRSRALTLARTEVVRAHSEATLNRFEDFGLTDVEGKAEFLTAQDDLVCPLCEALEGKVFTIKKARGIIPVHPHCRCTWLPVIPEGLGQELFGFQRRVYAVVSNEV